MASAVDENVEKLSRLNLKTVATRCMSKCLVGMEGAGYLLHGIDTRSLALSVRLRKIVDLIERNSLRRCKRPVHHPLLLCLHWGGLKTKADGKY